MRVERERPRHPAAERAGHHEIQCRDIRQLITGHLAFDRNQNYPLPNLFVSILQRMAIDAGKFASSTGTMSGLDVTKA